jgi:hypothetical protein
VHQKIVKLLPVSGTKPAAQFGSAKGLIAMADDFYAPLEDFDEYMASDFSSLISMPSSCR